jgi:hypothetical protein
MRNAKLCYELEKLKIKKLKTVDVSGYSYLCGRMGGNPFC